MGELIPFPAKQSERDGAGPRPRQDRADEPARPPRPDREPLWREAAGQVLRDRRRRAGRTLNDVAGDAGISVPYLSEIERGRKEPSSEMLAAVGGALGLDLAGLTAEVSRRLRGPVCLAA